MTALIRNNLAHVVAQSRCSTSTSAAAKTTPVIQSKHCGETVDAFVREKVTQTLRLTVEVRATVEQRVTKTTVHAQKEKVCAHVAKRTSEKVTRTATKHEVRVHAEKLAQCACHHVAAAKVDLHASEHTVRKVFEQTARKTFELSLKRSQEKRECGCHDARVKLPAPKLPAVEQKVVVKEHVVRQSSELAVRRGCEQVLRQVELPKPVVVEKPVVIEKPAIEKAPVAPPEVKQTCGCDDEKVEREALFWTIAGLIIGLGALIVAEELAKAPTAKCGCGDEPEADPIVAQPAVPTPVLPEPEVVKPVLPDVRLATLVQENVRQLAAPEFAALR